MFATFHFWQTSLKCSPIWDNPINNSKWCHSWSNPSFLSTFQTHPSLEQRDDRWWSCWVLSGESQKLFTVLSTTLSYGDITYLTTPKIYFSVVYELYFNMKLSGCFIFLPGGHYHTDGNAQNTASVGWITKNRYIILTGDPSSVWLLHLFHPEKDDSILNRVGKPVIFGQKTSSVLYLLFYQ